MSSAPWARVRRFSRGLWCHWVEVDTLGTNGPGSAHWPRWWMALAAHLHGPPHMTTVSYLIFYSREKTNPHRKVHVCADKQRVWASENQLGFPLFSLRSGSASLCSQAAKDWEDWNLLPLPHPRPTVTVHVCPLHGQSSRCFDDL